MIDKLSIQPTKTIPITPNSSLEDVRSNERRTLKKKRWKNKMNHKIHEKNITTKWGKKYHVEQIIVYR